MDVGLNVTRGALKMMVDIDHFQRGFLFCFMEEATDDRGNNEGFAFADLADAAEDE